MRPSFPGSLLLWTKGFTAAQGNTRDIARLIEGLTLLSNLSAVFAFTAKVRQGGGHRKTGVTQLPKQPHLSRERAGCDVQAAIHLQFAWRSRDVVIHEDRHMPPIRLRCLTHRLSPQPSRG